MLFNSLLILMPVVATQTLATAFAPRTLGDAATLESLETTRRNMDAAFEELVPRTANPRAWWSDQIDREIAEKDLDAAQGYMLAAPQILSRSDTEALKAAAKDQPIGTEDDRLLAAALIFLPNDVSARYDQAKAPTAILTASEAMLAGDTTADEEDAGDETSTEQVDSAALTELQTRSFALLGSFPDLADRSNRWINGDRVDPIVLKMTAIGLLDAQYPRVGAPETVEAASILRAASRARRLNSDLSDILNSRLEAALPNDVLRPALQTALADLAPSTVRGEKVKTAFRESLNEDGLNRLDTDLHQISRIADMTSPTAAISILEHVESGEDLRRARLMGEAGGQRMTALVKLNGEAAFNAADSGLRWTQSLILQLMGLAAAGLVLIFVALSSLQQAMRRRRSYDPEPLV